MNWFRVNTFASNWWRSSFSAGDPGGRAARQAPFIANVGGMMRR
jgi:hypothetical protein